MRRFTYFALCFRLLHQKFNYIIIAVSLAMYTLRTHTFSAHGIGVRWTRATGDEWENVMVCSLEIKNEFHSWMEVRADVTHGHLNGQPHEEKVRGRGVLREKPHLWRPNRIESLLNADVDTISSQKKKTKLTHSHSHTCRAATRCAMWSVVPESNFAVC